MFDFITDPEERGQVGIGTLIVFIAMVLVAAIAAGVLINTAGFLQSQAEATGEESTDLVSERIEVSSSVGIVSADDSTLSSIEIGVSSAPGADEIDLSETIIQVNGPEGQQTLTMANYGSGVASADTSFVNDGAYSEADIPNPGSLTFAIQEGAEGDTIAPAADTIDPRAIPAGVFIVVDSDDNLVNPSAAVLDGSSDFTIIANPAAGAFGNNDVSSSFNSLAETGTFGQGDQAQLDIISPSSSTTQVDLNAPDLFGSESEAVRL
jgi:flagellin FlaB